MYVPWLYSIIFMHGLRGHPRGTWETSAAYDQSDDGREVKKNHGMRSIFGMKAKHLEVSFRPGEASTHPYEIEPKFDRTVLMTRAYFLEMMNPFQVLKQTGSIFLGVQMDQSCWLPAIKSLESNLRVLSWQQWVVYSLFQRGPFRNRKVY